MSLSSPDLLRRALVRPETLDGLSAADWSRLLHLARGAALIGRLAADVRRVGLFERLAAPIQDQLIAGERQAGLSRRRITWEIDRLKRAFFARPMRLILLKGAAYYARGLTCGEGRFASDIDILVDRADLQLAEATLMAAGWEAMKVSAYDQRYYRDWMHELPPLRHGDRGTVIDVHHTILPLTSRLTPDAAKLVAAAQAVDGSIYVLDQPDMLLHSAVHLFQDGEIGGYLRDLVDQRDMLAEFGASAEFWPRLITRAQELGLTRPLYYSLRYAGRLLDAPVPAEILRQSRTFAPPLPVRLAMDTLVEAAIFPIFLFERRRWAALAGRCLYLRAHWLRMPPAMLAGHLGRKLWLKVKPPADAARPAAGQNAR